MIEVPFLRQLANRYQTTFDNVMREYFQHLFLSLLYQEKGSESLLFKGGTALRLIYGSPRFSEDLDFTGSKISVHRIEALVESVLAQIERQGIGTHIEESKKTSGGYFAIFQFKGPEYESGIQTEVSLRPGRSEEGTSVLIRTELLPPYTLVHLEEKSLIQEKIGACLTRAKPRDFYDLYFILRSRIAFGEVFARNKTLKVKLLSAIAKQKLDLRSELKQFLPVSQHVLLKSFKSLLSAEIERSLA